MPIVGGVSLTLAAHTLERATTALQSGQAACLPELVKLLHALSNNAVNVSVDELADVVQNDTAILAKVISAANTLGFNPSASPISSVKQAIHVIGYERIRTLAMSLMLIEHAARNRSPDEQREAAALALCSGFIAQNAAEGRFMLDPSHAFVCTTLRHFGRIVLTTFMVDEYREARALAGDGDDDEAFRQVLGLTPLELGRQLLKASHLPDAITDALRECPPEAIAACEDAADAQLLALTDFSAKLAELSFAPQINAAEFAVRSQALAARFHKVLPGLGEQLKELLTSSEAQFSRFVRSFGIRSLPTQNLARLRQRVSGIDPIASRSAAPPTPATSPPAPEKSAAVTKSATPNTPPPATPVSDPGWEAGLARLTALAATPGASREKIFSAALDIVQRGFGAPECLLFSRPSGSREFMLTHGRGERFQILQSRIRVRPDERTVFGICLTRRENVLIHQAADAKIAPYISPWLREPPAIASFALLPLLDSANVHGLILAGWQTPRQVIISLEIAQLIRTLLTMVSRVCEPATPR